MAKNPRCCCGPCTIRDGCGGIAFSSIEGHCCKCIPVRVCVSLFSDANVCSDTDWVNGTSVISTVEALWSDGATCPREYAGVLLCNGVDIDFSIRFHRDENDQCFWALESAYLGYLHPLSAGSGGVDSRVMVSMGGTIAARKLNCTAMAATFDIVFTDASLTTGRIKIEPAAYREFVKRKTCPDCLCGRVCLRISDGTTETTTIVCRDDDAWTTDFDSDVTKPVRVNLVSHVGDVTTLSLTSFLGDGSNVIATCDPMSARWDFDDGAFVSIAGDDQAKCTDCKCYCECLCVTYSDAGTYGRTSACYSGGLDGCGETFIPEDSSELGGYDFTFGLICTGCATKVTKISLNVPAGLTIVGTQERTIICPDQLSASWGVLLADGVTTVTVAVECKSCGDECIIEGSVTPCCPDRRMPLTLYATAESISGCTEIAVGTTIPLRQEGVIGALEDCWVGEFADTCHFGVRCNTSFPANDWYAGNAQGPCQQGGTPNLMTLVSCDPFEAVVTITGWGCCSDGPGAVITVRVTE